MQFELPVPALESITVRRKTTLHLMLAFVLVSLGAGFLLLYVFTATSRTFQSSWWYGALSGSFKSANRLFIALGAGCLLAGVGITTVVIFFREWLNTGRRNSMLRLMETALIAATGALFVMTRQQFPAAVFCALAALLLGVALWEMRRPAAQQIRIGDEGVLLPIAGGKKTIRWKEIERLLLRHGILTIELSRNRLIQRSIDDAGVATEMIEAFSKVRIDHFAAERAAANADW